jgi:hypothetical protein
MFCNGSRLTRAAKLEDGAPLTAFRHPAFPPPFAGHDTPRDLLRRAKQPKTAGGACARALAQLFSLTLRPLPACPDERFEQKAPQTIGPATPVGCSHIFDRANETASPSRRARGLHLANWNLR